MTSCGEVWLERPVAAEYSRLGGAWVVKGNDHASSHHSQALSPHPSPVLS